MTTSETVLVHMARSETSPSASDSTNDRYRANSSSAFDDSRPTTPYHIIEILLNSANGQLPGVSDCENEKR